MAVGEGLAPPAFCGNGQVTNVSHKMVGAGAHDSPLRINGFLGSSKAPTPTDKTNAPAVGEGLAPPEITWQISNFDLSVGLWLRTKRRTSALKPSPAGKGDRRGGG